MARRHTLLPCALSILLTASCTVGPDFQPPEVAIPPEYRAADVLPPVASAPSFGDLAWDSVFLDPDLQALIHTALAQNYDIQLAATRIQQAHSQVVVARSQQFPTLDGSLRAPYAGYRGSDRPEGLPENLFEPEAGFDIAWELDIWGRFRRNTEAARAELFAREDVQYGVIATLVAEVANAYVTLRALDRTLQITRRTVDSRRKSLDLVQARVEGGVAGILDVHQAETLLFTATKTVPAVERQIEETENFISILLGQDPGPIKRGHALDHQIVAPPLPPGLPTELLARRPDIRAAEQQLVAANAQIGGARAQLYPQVSLAAFLGGGTTVIEGDELGPYGIFSVLPAVTLPIFNAGRLRANVAFNEARAQEAALLYQQTLQQALREVSDALIGIRKRREFRQQQEQLVTALVNASDIAQLRYEGGVSSYLEVLDSERQLFDAELDLVLAIRDEFLSVIQLYRALGGGWSAATAVPAATVHEPVK